MVKFRFGEEPNTATWARRGLAPCLPGRECWLDGTAALSLGSLRTAASRDESGSNPEVETVGTVGHYRVDTLEEGANLLRRACDHLARHGLARVLGPMDSSTWHTYRLALPDPDPGEWFLGEPTTSPDCAAHFEAAGFTVDQLYTSTLTTDLNAVHPGLPALEARLVRAGVRIRPLDLARFDQELQALHSLAWRAFAQNPYFTPIGLEEFRALYVPMRVLLIPELVLLAEQGNELVGVVLAYPDRPGTRRVVLKTLATAPHRRGLGLGTVLTAHIHQAAARLGFESVIHALMHETNASQYVSRAVSACQARLWRRYALYSWSPGRAR